MSVSGIAIAIGIRYRPPAVGPDPGNVDMSAIADMSNNHWNNTYIAEAALVAARPGSRQWASGIRPRRLPFRKDHCRADHSAIDHW